METRTCRQRSGENETQRTRVWPFGQTWARVNKDGKPDRRFANNYAIPESRYFWYRPPAGHASKMAFGQAKALCNERKGEVGRSCAIDDGLRGYVF